METVLNLSNLKRTLTMLEKSLDRLIRAIFYKRRQLPDLFILIEETIMRIRAWLEAHTLFLSLEEFYWVLSGLIQKLGMLTCQLWNDSKPKPGKKGIKKNFDKKSKITFSIPLMQW